MTPETKPEAIPDDVMKAAYAAYDVAMNDDGMSLNSLVSRSARPYVIACLCIAILQERKVTFRALAKLLRMSGTDIQDPWPELVEEPA